MCVNLYEAMRSSIVGADIKGYSNRIEHVYIDVTTMFK